MLGHLRDVNLLALECQPQRFAVLRESCTYFIDQLEAFSNQLTEDYFSHATRRSR